ncbi:MAG: substrate-binding domain-containing protein [archaeon]|nr:substrate-binding domain-containing protein [archaeon]MCP8314789.1 substrate-binding domain-containing protein [archaeon]
MRIMKKNTMIWASIVIIAIVISILATAYYTGAFTSKRSKLVISTTTSLFDTGLLDEIEDRFEAKYPFDLYFISVGTGLAIQHAKRGDADMLLVHDPRAESTFLADGYGLCRKIIAYNFYVIVGPEDDPVGIKNLPPLEALTMIVEAGRNGEAKWVSRGDGSGTHSKEKSLWAMAGFDSNVLRDEGWYIEAGTSMGGTLGIANNYSAYTLTDLGTYLAYYNYGVPTPGKISLIVLVDQGQELLNVYSAIAVNPSVYEGLNFDGAITFIKFLISDEGQSVIEEYGKEDYGQSLFLPAVELLKENTDPTLVSLIKDYAYIDGEECPPEYQNGHPELYS